MFDIFKEVFFDSDLLVPAIIVIIVSFLIAEFKVNKSNTKIIVTALSVLVYVICSFVIEFVSSWLVILMCSFVGGFAISIFIGFAIEIAFRAMMKKRIYISVCIILAVLLVGVSIWWHLPVKRMKVDYDNIKKIVVTDLVTSEEIVVTDKKSKALITGGLQAENLTIKKDGFSHGDLNFGYKVEIKLKDDSLADMNGWDEFIVNSDNSFRKDPFYYKLYYFKQEDYSGNVYRYIHMLFQKQ